MTFLDRARPLIAEGFSVIPIEPKGKRPVAGLGVTNRTTSQAVAHAWELRWPDANVGICADENVVILETDDYERLEEIVEQGTCRHLPATRSACGSSENRPHFFFKRTERSTNVGNITVPGLFECRFTNQYVVGPGSVHPSGAIYRWLNTVDMVSIPDWLVSELARLALGNKNTTSPRQIREIGGRIPEGSRHYFLMRELGRLWDGKRTESEMQAAAEELNELCEPPKDAAHVLQCVRDIMRREPYDPGPTLVLSPSQPLVVEAAAPTATVEWTAQTATELAAAQYEPRLPILKEGDSDLFYERSVNQIMAWRGVGKTMFANALADAIAAGGRVLDFHAPTARRVLYLDGELPLPQLQERAMQLIRPSARDNVFFFNPEMLETPRGLNLTAEHDANALLRLIDKDKAEVLILDSQSTLMYGDTNDSKFQERRQDVLRQLRWKGLCIIEMHHLGKAGLQRGSSKNDDILDVQIKLDRVAEWEPEDGLLFEIKYEKVRHAARLETGYEVTFTDGKWVKQTSNLVQKVADLWKQNKPIRTIAKELDISKSRVERLKHKAAKLQLIELNEKTNH